jgi:hypothetical protein
MSETTLRARNSPKKSPIYNLRKKKYKTKNGTDEITPGKTLAIMK